MHSAAVMKSQDILLLLKIASLEVAEERTAQRRSSFRERGSSAAPFDWPSVDRDGGDWRGWHTSALDSGEDEVGALGAGEPVDGWSVRSLAASTGIGKNEVSAALRRCIDVALVRRERDGRRLRVNARALLDLADHCLRYVFPTRPGPLVRGIPTGFAAPVLADAILSAGEIVIVWPYARGDRLGQAIEPLYRSVPDAVQRDPDLYAMLALVDSLRLGNPRERAVARERLGQLLGV